jgi:hypothetical protein
MHFDFSVPVKKQKNHTQKVKLKLYTNVIKNVYCIAIIDINGIYKALNINTGEEYIITSRSYNVKTTQYYSQQLVNDKRIQVISLNPTKEFMAPWLYLPFAPGVGMLGNLVKSEISENLMFDLNKTFKMPKDNELARDAFLYFRDNYNVIYNNILNRYNVRESLYDDGK